ncbi:TolC family protein [Myroides odoratimimus]|uniref:TolC family type I secretion outer membrane protein n=1 Tax=Myroides odoratimimus CIP 101113 TaxID=883154 RepID=A0AAV3F4E8_9FLAO|nr:TolC family protein [Myroides odoratimimus]EHO13051.1 hypothetical protein HMPREF9715_01458 [Myroides odoratimimus CIP 101113]
MKKFITICLIQISFLLPIQGQTVLSFEECLRFALEYNLTLKEAYLEEELANIQYNRSKNNRYPNLSSSIANNNSFGRSIDPYSNTFIDTKFKSYSGSIGSNYVLFEGFSRTNAIKIAKSEVILQQTNIERVKNSITIELASIYTTILYTEELIKSSVEQLKVSKQQKEFIQIRFDEGLVAESELFKIEAQVASEKLNLITVKNSLQIYYLDLKQIMNISINTDINLKPLEIVELNDNLDYPTLLSIEDIYPTHPDFLATKIQEENLKINIKLSKSTYYPSLNLQLNYSSFYSDTNSNFNFNQQWNNNKNYGISLSLSLPIFNGFSTRYNVKRAKIQYKQGQIRTDIEKDRLIKVLSEANNDLIASHEKLKSASGAWLFSQKTFEADQLKYEYGKISLTELLLSQKNYFNQQAELIKAKYEHIYNIGVVSFYRDNIFLL